MYGLSIAHTVRQYRTFIVPRKRAPRTQAEIHIGKRKPEVAVRVGGSPTHFEFLIEDDKKKQIFQKLYYRKTFPPDSPLFLSNKISENRKRSKHFLKARKFNRGQKNRNAYVRGIPFYNRNKMLEKPGVLVRTSVFSTITALL